MYKFLLITIFSIIATNTFSQKWLEPMQVAISKLEKDAKKEKQGDYRFDFFKHRFNGFITKSGINSFRARIQ